MTIQLLTAYRGRRTQEKIIPAGTYADDDKRLMGLADYLVETGHARRLSGETTNAPPAPSTNAEQVAEALLHRAEGVSDETPPSAAHPTPDYDSVSPDDLKAEIERVGISLSGVKGTGAHGRLLKPDLIAILKGYHDDLGVWTGERWAEWDAERVALELPPWPRQEPPGHSAMV